MSLIPLKLEDRKPCHLGLPQLGNINQGGIMSWKKIACCDVRGVAKGESNKWLLLAAEINER